MTDSLQRFLFEGVLVRGEIVHLDATWRAVLERHEYPEPLRAALGELMAAAALLSATLKFTGSLIMQVQGTGPVKLIVVECTSEQTMRATAKWEGQLPAGGFRELVGDGRFVITIAPADASQTYQGVVELEGSSVAAMLEHYMTTSEQLATRLWLAATTASCGNASAAGTRKSRRGSRCLEPGGEAWGDRHVGRTAQAARARSHPPLISRGGHPCVRGAFAQFPLLVFA